MFKSASFVNFELKFFVGFEKKYRYIQTCRVLGFTFHFGNTFHRWRKQNKAKETNKRKANRPISTDILKF